VREQLGEGFIEQTPPDWIRRLDELVTFWEADDPGFDAEVLKSQLLAAGEALAKETIEKLTWWEEGQPRDPELARGWLLEHADTALPGVLLALRYPDAQVLLRVDALLAEVPRPEVIEALLSVIEHPTPEEGDEGRPSNMPLGALRALGKPDPDIAERLARALDHDDSRTRDVAAALLAEWAADDELFGVLWRHRAIARQSDGMCWAMMRAAEIRRAPSFATSSGGCRRALGFAAQGTPSASGTPSPGSETADRRCSRQPLLQGRRIHRSCPALTTGPATAAPAPPRSRPRRSAAAGY